MDPESRRLLEDTYVLAKDNHRMLRAVRRHQIITDFGKFIIWFILLGGAAISYLTFLKPIVDKIQASGLSGVRPGDFGIATTTQIGKLIDSFTADK